MGKRLLFATLQIDLSKCEPATVSVAGFCHLRVRISTHALIRQADSL